MIVPPALLAFCWWGHFHGSRIQSPKWRGAAFVSGLAAGTANFLLWWAWVIWLRLHYTPSARIVQDAVSNVGIFLLFYSIITAILGNGKHRVLLGISSVLAIIPWIPVGIL